MTTHEVNEMQARFDAAAAAWDSNPRRIEMARAVSDVIRKAVPLCSSMNVMDFGAGTGLLTLALMPDVRSITAVDASGEMLRILEQKLTALQVANVRTLLCNIAETVLPVAEFDLVVSSMVLHHIPDVEQLFRQIQPCLQPGGWIALADLDSEDGTFHSDPAGVFHKGFDRNKVCEWLGNAGFIGVSAQDAYRITRAEADGGTRQYGVFLVTGGIK